MRLRTLLMALFGALGVSCSSAPVAPTKEPPPTTLTFTDPLDRVYDARLRLPRGGGVRAAVLLLGGGSVTDMRWTVPATVPHEGREVALTSTGEPTRDADDIADALLARGFAVFQYSSIHQGDASHAGNPALADYVSYANARDIARAALETLRAQPGIDPDRIVLVGHSLGGARALQIAATDPGAIRAMALLAPAYASRLSGRPSLAAQEEIAALGELGLDAEAGIRRYAWRAKRAAIPEEIRDVPFDTIDRDRDEALRRWEIAGALAIARLEANDPSDLTPEPLFADETFPADALLQATVPTLLIFGGLDPMTVHAPLVERSASQLGASNIEVVIAPHRGHNLSTEVPREDPELAPVAGPTLTGPIDPRVTKLIADWLSDAVADEP